MFAVSTAEKIATIVTTFLASGKTEGSFGKLTKFEAGPAELPYPAGMRVEADGMCLIVRTVAEGWNVNFCGTAVVDADLEAAARLALASKSRVSTVTAALGMK